MSNPISFDDFIKTDDAIFHYTSVYIALEKIFPDDLLRLNLFKNTNDPYEYKEKNYSMMGMPIPQKAKDIFHEAYSAVDRIIRMESRMLSFCTNRGHENEHTVKQPIEKGKGWGKSRMWSQYGDNHRGICLVFSKKAIEAEFEGTIETMIPQHIKYTTKPDLSEGILGDALTLKGGQLAECGVEDYSYKHVKQYSDYFFFNKHIDYRDESEYRIVVIDPDNKHEHINISKSIRGIICGDKTPDVYTPLIENFTNRHTVESRRAEY